MHILDLAFGTGSVTKVIYEHHAQPGISPLKITGVDNGQNFITVFKENKAALRWDTVEGVQCDAANMSMFKGGTLIFSS